jgi:threonine/homoserine/homoserine lactone efflux protein
MFAFLLDLPVLRGMIVGMVMAAPVGAVGAMCIRHALERQRGRAMAVGLGSATCDGIFGFLAGAGVTALGNFILGHQAAIALVGGIIVLGLGIVTYRAPVPTESDEAASGHKRRNFAKAFALSITNPATLLGAVGLTATLGGAASAATFAIGLYTAGVVLGSILWWTLLTTTVAMLRERFITAALPQLNRFEGLLLAAFGVTLIAVAAIALIDGI